MKDERDSHPLHSPLSPLPSPLKPYWQSPAGLPYNESKRAADVRRRFGLVSRRKDAVMPVLMELSRIIRNEVSEQQYIFLKEIDGQRTFPIVIGEFEAASIGRGVNRDEPPPRPQTHDLIVGVVESLGGEFQDVVISELRDGTYFARLRVRHDGELIEIDARPSDAIAVAVRCEPALPIFVNEDVLNDVLGEQSGETP